MEENESNKLVGDGTKRTIYTAGWRPAIGWVCVLALVWNFMGYDIAVIFLKVENPPPLASTEALLTILGALLGLGGMRTWEKIHGKAK